MGILDSLKKILTGSTEHDHAGKAPAPQFSAEQYIAAIEVERSKKDHFFQTGPYSPIEELDRFTGLNYYPPDPAFRFILPLEMAEEAEPLTMQTSTGDEQSYYRLGVISFEIEGQPARLTIYQSVEHEGLFLPFRDATSGQETYGAGRYLEPVLLGEGNILVDFNLAYNPYCAYSEHYACPLPPFENWLEVPIRAGEKGYSG